jgi:uncharacterized delta-60 repeat protein
VKTEFDAASWVNPRKLVAFLLVIALSLVFAPAALAAPGDLDASFGGGLFKTDFGNGLNSAKSAVEQTDDKIVVAGMDGDGDIALARYNADGSLDTGFDGDGKVTTPFPLATTSLARGATDVALQSDGKLVVVGYSGNEYAMARYNPNGSLDTSFNGDGWRSNTVSDGFFLDSVAIQSDGKIVAVGQGGTLVNLYRFNADGSVDNSFDSDGKQTVDFGGFFGQPFTDLVIQSDGKIAIVTSKDATEFAVARINADGSPDTAFSGDGKETISFGGNGHLASDIDLQSDGKIVVSGTFGSEFAIARLTTAGALDTSFDGDGKVTTAPALPLGLGITHIDMQADGKIVVAGEGSVLGLGSGAFGVVRLSTDGSLDSAFSGDGKQTVEVVAGAEQGAEDVVVLDSGKLFLSGYAGHDFAAASLNTDGSLNTAFSSDGKQTTDVARGLDSARDVVVQPDGKIVVSGQASWGIGYSASPYVAFARYNSNGTLDTSFSGDGLLSQSDLMSGPGPAPAIFGTAQALALQLDGKIVSVGDLEGTGEMRVARLNSNGTYDTSFDGDGQRVLKLLGTSSAARDLVIQPDGKIVVLVQLNSSELALARFNSDGSLDTTFSGDGIIEVGVDDIGGFNTAGSTSALALQPDGKVVVVGGALDFEFARVNPDGTLDTSFDGDGRAAINLLSDIGHANGVVIQPNGKIVASGDSGADFTLVRLSPNGSLDTAFDGDGRVFTNFAAGSNGGKAMDVQLQADGRLVVVGSSFESASGDFAVARYNPNGSLDTTFSGDGLISLGMQLGSSTLARAAALQADGAIVVAGDRDSDFALARFEGGGTPPNEDPGNPPGETCETNPAICPSGGGGASGGASGSASTPSETKPPKPTIGSAVIGNVATVVGGKVRLQARCGTGAPCKGLAKLTVNVSGSKATSSKTKSVVIGSGRFDIPAGKSEVIRIPLNGTGKQMVKKAGTKGLPIQLVGSGLKARTIKLMPKSATAKKGNS